MANLLQDQILREQIAHLMPVWGSLSDREQRRLRGSVLRRFGPGSPETATINEADKTGAYNGWQRTTERKRVGAEADRVWREKHPGVAGLRVSVGMVILVVVGGIIKTIESGPPSPCSTFDDGNGTITRTCHYDQAAPVGD